MCIGIRYKSNEHMPLVPLGVTAEQFQRTGTTSGNNNNTYGAGYNTDYNVSSHNAELGGYSTSQWGTKKSESVTTKIFASLLLIVGVGLIVGGLYQYFYLKGDEYIYCWVGGSIILIVLTIAVIARYRK
ncbi:hypothetical protein PPL_10725 [Heterostelium album PN500]|uniref:Transmembrane protein n=1 Tax=Heterostelium pallidum (strain ATCC 26659 / Pp 5 / PN500) TaxID=670386 RepID=D3BRW2_HETP5|nr:hypothetical protein PPL_10725 [Heterostelium album PN500]EFA76144.1 hypothetical protein PPL_10725 [Heterostelium album PN500]|eukprot:XP_020428278.1 hypothetical protein PPL_10725 [Heterostelium album PN500]